MASKAQMTAPQQRPPTKDPPPAVQRAFDAPAPALVNVLVDRAISPRAETAINRGWHGRRHVRARRTTGIQASGQLLISEDEPTNF